MESTIGDNECTGECIWIANLVQITIANNAVLSKGAILLCGNHTYKLPNIDLMVGEIHKEEGAWGELKVLCALVKPSTPTPS